MTIHQSFDPTTLVVGGPRLAIADVVKAAREPKITIASANGSDARLAAGFDVVMAAAAQGLKVYGLTVGVGLNKDRSALVHEGNARCEDVELLNRSRQFNIMSLRAHAAGLGPDMAPEVVRAAMLIRFHTMASGAAGVQPAVAHQYRAFLNADITPVVPARGSAGEADITLAAHIGLAMMGEWFVYYGGARVPAKDALLAEGLSPLAPLGKDFLGIIGTNALAAAQACLALHDVARYLDCAMLVFGLALEGCNGNVAPFAAATTEMRPFPGMSDASSSIRALLEGSYLWQPDAARALQDPLSFRTMGYVLGNVLEALRDAEAALLIQINHSDDNPAVVVGPGKPEQEGGQLDSYRVCGAVEGAIYPTANFDVIPVVARIESLNLALARLSLAIVMQTLRFEAPELTGLPRFLSAETNHGHAFGALQKPLAALYAETRHHAMPMSLDTVAMAGSMEDMASNSLGVLANLGRILDNLYALSSIQLLHAAQAADLRRNSTLSTRTQGLLHAYRQVVDFVDRDRVFTGDIAAGLDFLRSWDGFHTTKGQALHG